MAWSDAHWISFCNAHRLHPLQPDTYCPRTAVERSKRHHASSIAITGAPFVSFGFQNFISVKFKEVNLVKAYNILAWYYLFKWN